MKYRYIVIMEGFEIYGTNQITDSILFDFDIGICDVFDCKTQAVLVDINSWEPIQQLEENNDY